MTQTSQLPNEIRREIHNFRFKVHDLIDNYVMGISNQLQKPFLKSFVKDTVMNTRPEKHCQYFSTLMKMQNYL